jgi:hypothetical protein
VVVMPNIISISSSAGLAGFEFVSAAESLAAATSPSLAWPAAQALPRSLDHLNVTAPLVVLDVQDPFLVGRDGNL